MTLIRERGLEAEGQNIALLHSTDELLVAGTALRAPAGLWDAVLTESAAAPSGGGAAAKGGGGGGKARGDRSERRSSPGEREREKKAETAYLMSLPPELLE